MSPTSDERKQRAVIRSSAEAELASHPAADAAALAPKEMLHELQVHQIELEMQNETLRQTQTALEESRDRYLHLYEFAPVGYLSLKMDSLIEEINLTGSTLLQHERKKLLQRSFNALVLAEDRPRWTSFFMRLKSCNAKASIEVALQCGDGALMQAQLDCECSQSVKVGAGDTVLLVVLHDISARKRAEVALVQQVDELRRWQQATLDREGRVLAMKKEVNALLAAQGQPPRYPSALDEGQKE